MKPRNIVFTLALAALSAVLGGCVADDTTAQRKSTVFGLYTYEPGAYTTTPKTTMSIRTDEATGMELPSGDRTTLFWGAITIEDY